MLVESAYVKEEAVEIAGFQKGTMAPDFKLATLTGDNVMLSDYIGKKVILNFWASWCGPCKSEMPHMQKYYERYSGLENVEIIAVNMTSEEGKGERAVADFVKEYELTFPVLLDSAGHVMELYEIFTIPTTFMIGTDGEIDRKILGPLDEEQIKQIIQSMK